VDKYIDKNLAKEHVSYILDRTGYKIFREEVLDGVELNHEAEVAERLQFKDSPYVLS